MHRGLRALVVSVFGAAMLLMSAAPAFAVNWLINSQLDLVANGHTVVSRRPLQLADHRRMGAGRAGYDRPRQR